MICEEELVGLANAALPTSHTRFFHRKLTWPGAPPVYPTE
jgi:hypothetical protein